jgi:protein SCO1/2
MAVGNAIKSVILGSLLALGTCALAQPPSTFMRDMSHPASQVKPEELEGVGITQKLDQQIPLDLAFKDETGKTVQLGEYFGSGKPVILNLVYYTCPMLCGEALSGEASALAVLKFSPGKEYEVVSVSFNPDETPQDAAAKKKVYIDRLNEHLEPKTSGEAWHFLTGQKPEIDKLAQAVGFHYRRDPKTGQYIHSTALIIVTPHGKIAQYYYGVEYSPRDIRLGLIEASRNKIGNLVDAVEIYCCRYDPNTGRYGAIISRILSLAGAATVLVLGGLVMAMVRMDKNRSSKGTQQA